ncbi:glycosyltransferase [Faunimonas pinastri]|uniref:glycosyltransferase n=1 Tax=Faunimonas pinastri TaxID=1855383 RepID=UPI0015A5AF20|nr:glycosyltransferase [Faunimonas pinastri]
MRLRGAGATLREAVPALPTAQGSARVVHLGRAHRALPPEIAFLERHGFGRPLLDTAARLADLRGTSPRDELFSFPSFDRNSYWRLLADDLGLEYLPDLHGADLDPAAGPVVSQALRRADTVHAILGGEALLVRAPDGEGIEFLRASLARLPGLDQRVRIAAPEAIRTLLLARRRAAFLRLSVERLRRAMPDCSASRLHRAGFFSLGIVFALVALFMSVILHPMPVFSVAAALVTMCFCPAVAWKLAAAFIRPKLPVGEPLPDHLLPTYTIMVALYQEGDVVQDLLSHLDRIDYPRSKLQILLVLEEDDADTHFAAWRAYAERPFETVLVPPCRPRNKPKALVYALPFARGDHVVVFDAEDRPEPGQLRQAAALFHEDPELGCLQAKLTPDTHESWYARMFTLEYATHFEVLLPALAAWKMPLPLGGTSNHFPRHVLERVGAWDPFNVTEDADLGVRLARFGYKAAMFGARTFEEAPVTLGQWLPQRRRWIKGWIQTALVCFMAQGSGRRDLPLVKALSAHVVLTIGVLGLLLYPVSILAFVQAVEQMLRGVRSPDLAVNVLSCLAVLNAGIWLFGSAVASLRGLRSAGAWKLAPHVLWLPIYWALMSLAAWQALFQVVRDPFHWEKTKHGVARHRGGAVKGEPERRGIAGGLGRARVTARLGSLWLSRRKTAGSAPPP